MGKRLLSFALAMLLLIPMTGCRGSLLDITESAAQQTINAAPSQASVPEVSFSEISSIRIPYDPTDTLSPYTVSTSVNRYICGLIYDPLVRLKPDYSYERVLAKQITSEDYTVWTITIPGNISFPDGEQYNAYDVRYSLFRAMTDGSYYSASLSNVGNVVVLDDYTVRITLLGPDRYFVNLLTFPIIEFGTIEAPVGIGRYTLSEDGKSLTSTEASSPISTIELVEIEDRSMLLQELRIGVFDCVFVDDPSSVSMASIGGTEPVTLNNLVFLGMNSYTGFTSSARFRRAVEHAIDREALVQNVYGGKAAAAPSIFNPAFYELEPDASRSADLQSANDLLDELGYTARDDEGYRTYGYFGGRITLDLAVNSESSVKTAAAAAIKEMLAPAGIDVNIVEYSYQGYLAAVENGAAELYIGEVKLGVNMDVSPLISPEGGANFGFAATDALYEAWLSLSYGELTYEEFDELFYSYAPFAPLIYRYGDFVYSRSLYFDVKATESDIFYNITQWR